MKFFSALSPVVFALLFSTAAISADLPQIINATTASHSEKVGTVSISHVSGSTDDAVTALQQKAAMRGASKLRIISLGNPGDSDLWYGNADVYR